MNCEDKRNTRCNHCVICNRKEGLRILHKLYTDMSTSYAELLVVCFSIEFLDTHLGKDNMLCTLCIENIKFCIDFRKQVEIAHKKLYNKTSTESSVYNHFKINKAEITIKPCRKAEPHDEDNKATKNVQIHDNIKHLLAVEIKMLSKMKKEFEAMDYYSDNNDRIPVVHDYYSDNRDVLHEENGRESDSCESVKSDEMSRATECKTLKEEPFSIPELDPTQTQCPLCETQHPDNNLLNKHYMTHYPAYICHVCGKPLMTLRVYKRHLISHSKLQIPCDLCERKFKNSEALHSHKKIRHLKHSPLVCPHCEKRFKSTSVRKRHILEAHGIKPTMYKCPECDLEFYSPCHVERHRKRIHLKIREHHCQICYMAFFDSTELKFHISAKHEGKRSYKCEMCDRTYGYAQGLRYHRMKHHNQEG